MLQDHLAAAYSTRVVDMAVDECREYLARGSMPAGLIEDAIGALVFQYAGLMHEDIDAAKQAEADFRSRMEAR